MEYDFEIMYKPNRPHLMENALSPLPNKSILVRTNNQTYDAHLFTL